MIPWLTLAVFAAHAGPLDEYKDQKHGERDKVTKQTCEQAYIQRCRTECPEGDQSCIAQCKTDAPQFCLERQRRKTAKTAEVAVKGGSVVAGGVAVVATNAIIRKKLKNGTLEEVDKQTTPFTVYYYEPSLIVEGGAGALLQGTMAGTTNLQARFGPAGFGAMNTTLTDGSDWLSETDLGPTVTIVSPTLMFSLQPSVLLSHGNDVEALVGGGVRSYTTAYFDQVMIHFDPMLGVINGQWNYHLRLGGSYRFTPGLYARLSYDYRDIVDLTDLDISQASLQGIVLTVGGRYN